MCSSLWHPSLYKKRKTRSSLSLPLAEALHLLMHRKVRYKANAERYWKTCYSQPFSFSMSGREGHTGYRTSMEQKKTTERTTENHKQQPKKFHLGLTHLRLLSLFYYSLSPHGKPYHQKSLFLFQSVAPFTFHALLLCFITLITFRTPTLTFFSLCSTSKLQHAMDAVSLAI